MSSEYIVLWNEKITYIKKICCLLKITPVTIRPIKLTSNKGVVLLETLANKYIIKWNQYLSVNECREKLKATRYINSQYANVFPDYLEFSEQLFVDNCYYYIYEYLYEDCELTNIMCFDSLAKMHKVGHEYYKMYFHNHALSFDTNWLDRLLIDVNEILYYLDCKGDNDSLYMARLKKDYCDLKKI